MSIFTFRGPLAPDDPGFRGRTVELQRLRRLCEGDVRSYAIIYGGRQNGKTSLLLRLEASLPVGARSCLVDFQAIPGADITHAGQFLIKRVTESMGVDAPMIEGPSGLITALSSLVSSLGGGRLVLMLEELGALPHGTRHDLANVLRSCFTGRYTTYRSLTKLVVIMAGGVELYDLAATEVSTLHNICEDHYLGDLSEEDACSLASDGLMQSRIAEDIARRCGQAIYAVTNGHPYLTQRIADLVESALYDGQDFDRAIAAATEQILHGDPLLRHLRNGIEEQKVSEEARNLLTATVRFSRMDEPLARLELLGLVGEREQKWRIRNQLFERLLRERLPPASLEPMTLHQIGVDRLNAVADLELWLQRYNADVYVVTISFTPPGSTTIKQLVNGDAKIQIDLERLRAAELLPEEYGRLLTTMLSVDQRIRDAFIEARSHARGAGVPLRIRVRLGVDDPITTAVNWELLQDPVRHTFLCTSAEVYLSRLPTSSDEIPVIIPTVDRLRALVAVAAPSNLSAYRLSPINAVAEAQIATSMLGTIRTRALLNTTLATLSTALLERPHLLYLVCHGAVIDGEAILYLSGPDGTTSPTKAASLVERLQCLEQRPSVVVLASCASAGSLQEDVGSHIALAPQLARAGISAVLAMQGQISSIAIQHGMPTLFAELMRHGNIDRATAAMRNVLAAYGDNWWQPVLYLRLKDGQVWTA